MAVSDAHADFPSSTGRAKLAYRYRRPAWMLLASGRRREDIAEGVIVGSAVGDERLAPSMT
jgi:hypothetical protein